MAACEHVDEVTVRRVDGGWVQVDLFFEAGVAYMRDLVNAGDDANPDADFVYGKASRSGSGSRRCGGVI